MSDRFASIDLKIDRVLKTYYVSALLFHSHPNIDIYQDEVQRAQRNKNAGALIERKLAILDRALGMDGLEAIMGHRLGQSDMFGLHLFSLAIYC